MINLGDYVRVTFDFMAAAYGRQNLVVEGAVAEVDSEHLMLHDGTCVYFEWQFVTVEILPNVTLLIPNR